ncbi:hypothetical protein BH18VER1_BH18VER1_16300 [soil metagenome]
MAAQVNAGSSLLERPRTFWFAALLIALLFGGTNLPWKLDDYDQAKQAFTSFEMVNGGNWLFQHTPNGRIATKPPLVGWSSVLTYGATRDWNVAWRLPSIAAALALATILTRTAASAYGRTAALIAMSAFGLNLLSPRLATLVRTDMALALVVFLIGLLIWKKIRSGSAWNSRDRGVMFALLTASMLIKGPIVYAFLLPGILAFTWWRRGSMEAGTAWCGWWPWIASLAVFLSWAAAGIAWVPGFHEQVVLREFAGRFSETVHRPQPLYFYLPHLLHKFAPWSILGIAVAVLGWRGQSGSFTERARQISPEIAWLVCWSLGGLIVMSLIPSKRVDRIFPVVPPLCLLLAAGVSQLSTVAPRVIRWSTVALLSACVFSGAYGAQRVVISYRSGDDGLVRFAEQVRRGAVMNGWRYEVIGGSEEGLLLYLRRTRFLKADEAVARWNGGELDALVMPADDAPRLLASLPDATETSLEGAITINDRARKYVLLKRR